MPVFGDRLALDIRILRRDRDLRVMDETFGERIAPAEQFRDEAIAAMQMAEAAANEAARVEYLRIAMEWLKLAAEIDQTHGSASRNGPN